MLACLEMPSGLRTADFEIEIPPGLIAARPAPARDQSRLLLARRDVQAIEHQQFPDLLNHLRGGDVLVLNDSRVIPARLRGRNPQTGGHFEILLLEETAANVWWAMLRPGRRARLGTRIEILDHRRWPAGIAATVEEINPAGHRRLRFSDVNNIFSELDALGEVPLPPYIQRDGTEPEDRERYQTVYARAPGSVAAPTAGLHFTEPLLEKIRARGVKICFVTLHVGAGTFAPVKAELLAEHRMHRERFEITPETARLLAEGKAAGARIVAAGTTTLRVLESVAAANAGRIVPGRGATDIFIYPPYEFKIVDSLLTNFHLTRSTLLMLVCAFAAPGGTGGREFVFRAYREAVERRYRFFSYGDAMLLV
ncbi:MAG: tRNA preQ1(34) S-adenosylmethionine ribosyltransferase-isomerase QueA [Verrucomicrobiota bacterium]|jgi:S-adenosylmethionine:tRNA ribosyltransferase-isomerase